MEVDAGKPMADIISETVPDALRCYIKCAEDADCKFWSFIEPSYSAVAERNTCYLKKSQDWTKDNPSAQNGITSGAKSKICPGFEHSDTTSEKNSAFLILLQY